MTSPYTPGVTASHDGVSLSEVTHRAARTGSRHAVVACDTVDGRLRDLPRSPASDGTLDQGTVLGHLARGLRSTDAAMREPGGLFLVILDRVRDLPDAIAVAERISRDFEGAAALGTSLCCGVTLVEFAESESSLITRVHGALLLAQDAGAGRVVSSPPR